MTSAKPTRGLEPRTPSLRVSGDQVLSVSPSRLSTAHMRSQLRSSDTLRDAEYACTAAPLRSPYALPYRGPQPRVDRSRAACTSRLAWRCARVRSTVLTGLAL
jgi:hypothetical protein